MSCNSSPMSAGRVNTGGNRGRRAARRDPEPELPVQPAATQPALEQPVSTGAPPSPTPSLWYQVVKSTWTWTE